MHRTSLLLLLAACGKDPEQSTPTEDTSTAGVADTADTADTGGDHTDDIVPLYDASTELEAEDVFVTGDAIVTRFADRGRDRHAREDEFQSYDHYLPQYWEYRTVRMKFVDRVASGDGSIDVSFVSEWRLSVAEFRAWYLGLGTVASYSGNYAQSFEETGPGTFDDDHVQVSDEGDQYRYTYTLTTAYEDGVATELAVGQMMEFETSLFLDGAPGERQNYYGTTHLYAVGVGGLMPWKAVGDFADASSEREKSYPIDVAGWSGGGTTLSYNYSDEPQNHFMQLATNLSPRNGQPFVQGRRIHHTDMLDGSHDESPSNGTFDELTGLAGPLYVNTSCDACHTRNGRAAVAEEGVNLDAWVFKVGAADGPDPLIGSVLQPGAVSGEGEGEVTIESWEEADGLRTPVFGFSGEAPARYSPRIAPQLVGMGLLEAIPESTVLGWADASDADGDGISGRPQVVADPVTGEPRLGRFGWKAGTSSVLHQTASALNTDMGVMTSMFPEPDCGSDQTDCGNEDGAELSDAHLDDLVRYVSLLGVRARRDLDDATALDGEVLFDEIGCASCHQPEVTTSAYHPLAELRSQTIHPYTDLLLHDMGPELADNLGEGVASGAEWRTAPLWSLGLGACVTGGVEGPTQSETCTPSESYLHDGRARTLEEAIEWHGGEGAASRDAFQALSSEDQAAVVHFLKTL